MSEDLDFTIITGLSGAGRSTAADVLEDLGYFVIDNVPPQLIPKVAELAIGDQRQKRYALVIDARTGHFVEDLQMALEQLRELGARTRILFLDAADDALVTRFEATRRPHPMATQDLVSSGITAERELLEELKAEADVIVDTSVLNVHELRERLQDVFSSTEAKPRLQANIVSFGYKHGLPRDVDLVFDCRFIPNPHWIPDLRPLTGLDAPVREMVMAQEETAGFVGHLRDLLAFLLPAYVAEGKSYLSIGIGCTGGRHRSVVLGEELGRMIEDLGYQTRVHHRDVGRG